MKVETVLIDLEPAEAPKKRVPSPSKPKKPARKLTKSEEYLIDYWIETGKVRRDGRFPEDTSAESGEACGVSAHTPNGLTADSLSTSPLSDKDVYLFQYEWVGDVELPVPWSEFFQMFNNVNHDCFLKELEGDIVENPFDPWRNQSMVGINIRIRPHNRQDYQLVKVIPRGDAMNREGSDVAPANLHKDVLIVPFTRGDQVRR